MTRSLLILAAAVMPHAAVAQGAAGSATPASTPNQTPTPTPATGAEQDDAWLRGLDPDAPMEELPDLGVDWPDQATPLPPLPPLVEAPPDVAADADTAPAEDTMAAMPAMPGVAAADDADPTGPLIWTADAQLRRYRVTIDALAGVDDGALGTRFDELSVLRAGESSVANGAQISRRIADDSRLIETLLRNAGFYDASITPEIRAVGDVAVISFSGSPGPLYRYSDVRLIGIDRLTDTERVRVADIFGVRAGDPIDAYALVDAQVRTRDVMLDSGYPFVTVGGETVTIDHDVRQGVLEQPLEPGRRLRFGTIIANDAGLLGARHIQDIALFAPGALYQQSQVEDLRRALIATGLVGSLSLTPQANDDGEHVDIAVDLTPAPLRTIAGSIGYGSGEGVRAEASWQHRNFFPPEGAVLVRGVLGTREQLGSFTFRRNNWRQRDRALTLQALVSNANLPAFDARTVQLSAAVERVSTLIYQKRWTWAARAEILATDELAFVRRRGLFARQRYGIAAVSGQVALDRSDDLLDPRSGFRLSARVAPEISLRGSVFSYARLQMDASGYLPVAERAVLAARLRVGAIVGAGVDNVAPSRRLYAGGGSSVRGYAFQAVGPQAPNGDPIGGSGLFEFAAEARIGVFGPFSIVPFVDGGNVYDSGLPSFSDIGDLRIGAGLGIRYASNFGPIRVDIGTPVNPRAGDSRIGVYVSIGQAF